MEHAEKMYLVPQHQLEKLKSGNGRENIQQVVENDLDDSVRNILLRTDLNQYEKAKLYTNILSRFLAIVKQGDRETSMLTLALPNPAPDHKDDVVATNVEAGGNVEDVVAEVLKNVPARSVKNSRYILDKMSKAKGISSWTESGEFVFRGKAVQGSHMVDLLKNVTAPQKVRDDRRPLGWSEFLQAFAELNIPFSTVPNHHVRRMINGLKSTPATPMSPPIRPSKKPQRYARSSSRPSEDAIFKSPSIDRRQWLEF